ncbi:MAG: DeoR/GlpR family DNA-binding transcription regulator [Micromonosporaceae bacterium]
MLAHQRQATILEMVKRDGGVRVSNLVQEFGVSDMTIRRDLETLEERGLVAKVHGGATPIESHATDEPGYAAKSTRQQAEKEAIARRAADLVHPGATVALSAGTTTATLARYLTQIPALTVVTNSIPAADALHRSDRTDQTVVLTGGQRTPSDALVGPVATTAISSLHTDLVFLGVHGIDERAGLTTPNLMEAEINRALINASRRLIVLADHTKWQTVGISTIAPLDRADIVISDDGLPADAREVLTAHVGELYLAGAST